MGPAGPFNSVVEFEGCALSGPAFRVFCLVFHRRQPGFPGPCFLASRTGCLEFGAARATYSVALAPAAACTLWYTGRRL
eukprot:4537444-Pyramimonas_sp.AAC.1